MLAGLALKEQAGAVTVEPAACVTVKVWPAMVIMPLRAVVPVLAATVYETVPLPLNDVLEIVIQLALLVAVQVHVEGDVLTLIVPVLAAAPMDALLAPSAYVQEDVLTVTVALAGVPVPAELVPATV